MSSVKDSLGNLGTKLLLYPINFIISIIIARYLGPEDRGIYSYILVILSFLIPIISLGFGAGVMYYISTGKYKIKDVFVTVNIISILIGMLAATVIVLLWSLNILGESAKSFSLQNIFLLSGSIIFTSNYFFNTRILLGNSNFKLLNIVDIFQSLFNPFVILIFVYLFSLRVNGIFISLFIANSILAIILILFIKKHIGVRYIWQKDFLTNAISYGLKGWFGDMAIKANVRLDQIILGAKVSSYSLGIYSIAVLLAELIWVIPDSVGNVLFNRITKIEKISERVHMTTRIARILLTLSFFVSLCLLLLSYYLIIPYGYGPDYYNSLSVLIILIPGSIMMIFTKVATKLLSGSAMIAKSSQIQIISAIVGVALYIFLIPFFGYYGAAIASSIAYIVGALCSLYLMKKYFSISFYDFAILRKDDMIWTKNKILKLVK
ncbi:MAG: oligosaccharide flippase family protein [Bacteroidia bacterium]|nr:oligosaccharide flippase family protein [Bacteroidia bacterium]HRO07525.1 oligosaccharide flippase family protein [Saprospiraceae bacterium]HRP40808.1 oligosaccharide flippase family protein [Saprospiraceae bacterium]